jgi:hypothetical protein
MSRRVTSFPNVSVPLPGREASLGVRPPCALGVTAGARVPDEGARTRLISDISSLLHEPAIPDSARSAGLELIGWLARRMPGEAPHALGVEEAQKAKRARRKVR